MLDSGQRPIDLNPVGETKRRVRSDGLEAEDPSYGPGTSWQIQRPKGETGSVEQRLRYVLKHIKESQREGDVLVQMWAPAMRGNQRVVTTCGQPFLLDFNCQRLVNYRSVSTRYQFLADESSHEAVGLPGRVFLGRLPEWTPDVRYFSSFEYPRVGDAQRYDVRGTIALPIFERNGRSCLGVVEVVMTTQKVNYSYDLENICNALQAVDLRSSEVLNVPRLKMTGDSCLAAIPEIQMVLRTACETHRLPLAQTWISCIQQGREGSRHSDESFKECVSTVDEACYIQDPSMLGFQQACSEHHLFRGQGVVGKAFLTNQPCFSSDVTEFSKIEYPLSHHAKLFHLRAAVAIRLRCVHSGNVDFVLEFFLPIHCIESEEQKLMLNSLSITIQQACQTLRVVTTRELEDEAMLDNNEQTPPDMFSDKSVSEIASVPMEQTKEFEGFSVSTHWDPSDVVLPTGNIFSEFKRHHEESNNDYMFSFSAETNVSNVEKATEKRRAKTERTVSLQELQKYFAGSLKDAARSLGVCPTTLKRICRQHGIPRWPSRKIKKVGRSLRKLQVVIDSVHGPGEAVQFSSLYENFIKNTRSDSNLATPLKQTDHPESSNTEQQLEGRFTSHTSGTNSLSSSSCSQNSNSSQGCSSEQRQCNRTHEFEFRQAVLVEENQSDVLNEVQIHVELHCPLVVAPKSVVRLQSQRPQIEHHPSRCDFLKVKAVYGEEKVIFRLQPTWGFQDLKQEIARRFVVGDTTSVDIKYLDEDSEWILITCDEDLKECIDVYRSTQAHTIKLSVHHVQPTTRYSLGSTALS
ncbi:RWP-RK domain [Musa troglodytarum]|uniref:RWP-RK domain n=1 Tax=Musa troglodytarum TaxID=320322 RepID=A0A9E7JIM8_9LILI|nr:RWP-RK domain [Musa troglodytarum]